LVSYGGSSLILVLCAVGVLLAFARREPAAAAAIAAREDQPRWHGLRAAIRGTGN
jgi:cell division protein FtsW